MHPAETWVSAKQTFVSLAVRMDGLSRWIRSWHLGRGVHARLSLTALERGIMEVRILAGLSQHCQRVACHQEEESSLSATSTSPQHERLVSPPQRNPTSNFLRSTANTLAPVPGSRHGARKPSPQEQLYPHRTEDEGQARRSGLSKIRNRSESTRSWGDAPKDCPLAGALNRITVRDQSYITRDH